MAHSEFLPRRGRLWLSFGLCVIFLCILMSCVPLASDDVEFGNLELSGISDLMRYVLYYGNGRFLGNVFSVVLSQLPVLGVIVKALVIAGFLFLLPAVLDIRDGTGYLLSFLLFLSIRQAFFGQVYTWTSGFSNYLLPIWTTLLILLLIRRLDFLSSPGTKALFHGVIFLLGVSAQLYIEHCSVMNVLLAGCFVILRRKNGRSVAPAVNWLIASLIGLAVMFAIPVVFYNAASPAHSYRSVDLDGIASISGLLRTCDGLFVKMGAAFPPVGSMAAAALAAVTTWFTRERRDSRWNTVLYTCCGCVIAYFFMNEFLLRNMWFLHQENLRKGITACFAFLPFLLWSVVLFSLEDKQVRGGVWFLLAMAVCSLLPFLVVSPSPARTMFYAYVCTVAAILLFYRYLREKLGKTCLFVIHRSAQFAAVMMSLLLILIFTNIAWISELRETHIRQEMEKGKTEIIIFEDPYAYVHFSGVGCYNRCFYYEEPCDITFTSTDFETWYKTVWLKKDSN